MTEDRNPPREALIRPLIETDLGEADRIQRVAFGTFRGVPDPSTTFGDASWVRNRWTADPDSAFAAEMDGEIVGSVFVAHWGSFAFVGPLTVRPDLWDRGIGGRLMEPAMDLLSRGNVRLAGLFTFPHSPKHVAMYQKYGFSPRFLTAVMGKPVGQAAPSMRWGCYSQLPLSEKTDCLHACSLLTDSLFEGLHVTPEIRSIESQRLGDTVLLWDESELLAFAVCHCGPQTEAGSDTCYVKFAAVRPSASAARHFDELLSACESFATSRGASQLIAGVNTSRREAYAAMLQRGFRIHILGIAMHRPDDPGFSREGVYVMDDWR